jgi:hypothetical protein
MATPHYVDPILKMSGPNGVIAIKGNVKQAYDCDRVLRGSGHLTSFHRAVESQEDHG